ncbi:hypothetical protein KL918_000697 [Ogataea parapolymorpha]|uniref:DNA replication licensing factor MCM7 n=1 Tax=Ogataea parapolymorpha (strain ATCC 26012 / BCRC 20466 / JCM 22074 / NRRL Y-7560 / DL-1) TaxID=871575 RepID=W1QBK0_OGAPD|nr:DNA replication licensing factor MCM7 [Ogataea parapolymorpha DL-1]ESW97087.1 DNA replication licensing factor MCM7 [Ogataea parapolymorpha DL-1]KAG7869152.1 hypothetical protein KL918_000697 [Ogataea parapolymorpha]KAG7875797.1 hypothetical protein KL916_000468 [Ogataea parapolymorpha]
MATLAPGPTSGINSILPTIDLNFKYSEIRSQIKDFFLHFKSTSNVHPDDGIYDYQIDDVQIDDSEIGQGPKYMNLLQKIANREITTLYIDLDDIKLYEDTQNIAQNVSQSLPRGLAELIVKNTYHYVELFSQVVDEIMPLPTVNISHKDDVLDVIIHQRKLRNARIENEHREELAETQLGEDQEELRNVETPNLFPPQLTRRYCIYFRPLTVTAKGGKALAVRDVKGSYLGQLITVRGIVTRVSDVKPTVQVTAYTCDTCGFEIFQEVNTRTFTPLTECTSERCTSNQHRGKLFPSTRASKFSAFQDVKIQELANQVPVGHIPRTLSIHVNGDLVRSMNPGDIVDVTGIFLPAPYTGFRALRAGLLTETYLEAQFVKQHKRKYEFLGLTPEVEQKILEITSQGNVYERLANSIAPEIFGHTDIKKALLLLLVGASPKEIGDGMRIRGDINILLMGDPGVAKSQLLKSISTIAPRGVYTTGKGSSGVGLTAAVMRDPITDEMVLEGGALVLADNGICCIDEFDKMEEGDRTAIHEVMEQQTISISKAGITTTLNARASILAAANPLYGRYNTKLSPNENINLPAALLSRFDVLFLILDRPSREDDERLAEHVAYVHMHNKPPEIGINPIDSSTMRQFISMARRFRPVVTKEVSDYVVQAYIKMRKESKMIENSKKYFSHTTPRTLLAVLRLSLALARVRFSNEVVIQDVDEALRLMNAAKQSLYQDEAAELEETPTAKIFNLIKEKVHDYIANNGNKLVPMSLLRDSCLGKGFTENLFNECIYRYQALSVWQVVDDGENLAVIGNVDDEDIDMF